MSRKQITQPFITTTVIRQQHQLSTLTFQNKPTILNNVSRKPHLYNSLSPMFKSDIDVVSALLKQNLDHINLIPKDLLQNVLLQNEQLFINVAPHKGMIMRFAPEHLRSNAKIMISAIMNTSHAFQFASEQLKNDRKFILKLLGRNYAIFGWLSDELKNDVKIAERAIKVDSDYFYELKPETQALFEIKCAVSKYNTRIFFNILKNDNDNELAKYAMKNFDNHYYNNMPEKMKEHIMYAFIYMSRNGNALNLPWKLRNSRVFAKLLADKCSNFKTLHGFSEKVTGDKELLFAIIRENGLASFLWGVPHEIKNDRDFMLKLMRIKQYHAIQSMSNELKKDVTIQWLSMGHHKTIEEMGKTMDVHFNFKYAPSKRSLDDDDEIRKRIKC